VINYKQHIINVPDYPVKGIQFKDLTPLWSDTEILFQLIKDMAKPWERRGIRKVVAIESRGFIIGSALAIQLGCGFVPIRKPGKLPRDTFSEAYDLEYGSTEIHIHKDALTDENVLIVDDLLATGGTALAAYVLLQKNFPNVNVAGFSFMASLDFLQGHSDLSMLGLPIESLVSYS
jgi:adenine phosphoribosyltransferase